MKITKLLQNPKAKGGTHIPFHSSIKQTFEHNSVNVMCVNKHRSTLSCIELIFACENISDERAKNFLSF